MTASASAAPVASSTAALLSALHDALISERRLLEELIAQMRRTLHAPINEGESRQAHTEKLLPQPQVVFAFGLRMTNCEPVRLSR